MGLEDLIPDDSDDNSSSSSSSRNSSSSDEQEYITIGSEPHQKKFTPEKWEEVKEVLRHEMGLNVNRVKNRPAEERFEILHEAATYSNGEIDEDEMQNWSKERCIVCGKAANKVGAKVDGEPCCVHHTVGQLEKELDED